VPGGVGKAWKAHLLYPLSPSLFLPCTQAAGRREEGESLPGHTRDRAVSDGGKGGRFPLVTWEAGQEASLGSREGGPHSPPQEVPGLEETLPYLALYS